MRMRQSVRFLFFVLIVFTSSESLSAARSVSQDASKERRQEESEDYYGKWLKEDVVYIITPEERTVFEHLTTPDEKERFIEQFWLRRDPDLSTPENEYKEEHYRRIAYANEHFAAGAPGWRTDRGRIYIIHGPPAEIEAHTMGQAYDRPANEGGGQTVTYPFQIWRYRHLEGIGDNVEIEFVDPDGTNTFHLALTPWEKDALLMVPGAGRTTAEQLGLASRADHPYFRPYNADNYFGMQRGEQDDPFVRYERLARIQRSEPIKYKDLKELVKVDISYDSIPFKTRSDYFRLGPDQVLTSLSLDVLNKELSFKPENGVDTARVAVYGVVTSISNTVVSEFDDDLAVSYPPDQLRAGLKGRAVYQKVLLLDSKLRYRLDLIIKDLNSNKVGHQRIGLIPPRMPEDRLATSSLVLADELSQEKEFPKSDEMFLIGDVKVRPNLRKVFAPQDPCWVYLQAYNVRLDQASLKPTLTVTYRVVSPEKGKVLEFTDRGGETIQFFSSQRVVLIKQLPLEGLSEGRYQLTVELEDELSGQSTVTKDNFEIANGGS